MLENSHVSEELAASQERLSSMELVSQSVSESVSRLELEFLCIWVTFVKENNTYAHRYNSPPLDAVALVHSKLQDAR
jgi:hypothetical protein